MLRIKAVYQLAIEDFAIVDEFTDRVLDALYEDPTVIEPDIAVSLTDRVIEVWMLVDTVDLNQAWSLASSALERAFAVAGGPVDPASYKNVLTASAQLQTAEAV